MGTFSLFLNETKRSQKLAHRKLSNWFSLSSSLESMCHILISPMKYKADIGWPSSLRHKLGRKSSGLVVIKQSFVNVRVRSGLAAMETLGLGLKPVLLNSKGRCPYYQCRVYLWWGAAGFSSSGEEGAVMTGPGLDLAPVSPLQWHWE